MTHNFHLLEIAPITKVKLPQYSLTYLAPTPLPRGAFVTMPLRNKNVIGFVLGAQPARTLKTQIKKSSFSIKSITSVISEKPLITSEFLDLITTLANDSISHPGAVAYSLIPQPLLRYAQKTPMLLGIRATKVSQKFQEPLWMPFTKRLLWYKKTFKQIIKNGNSVLCITPTAHHGRLIYEYLSTALPQCIYWDTASKSKKELGAIIRQTIKKPSIIIGTHAIIGLPIYNVEALCLEQEESRHFKMQNFPYLDIRDVCTTIYSKIGCPIYRGSHIPRFANINNKKTISAPIKISKAYIHTDQKNSSALYPEVIEYIKQSLRLKQKVLLYINRRGVASTTICQDCGYVRLCVRCQAPMVLHTNLMCHHCGLSSPVKDDCSKCGSWKLKLLGTGIQKVEQELRKNFPDVPITRIDRDTKIKKTTPFGPIILATQRIFSFIREPVDTVILLFPESMLSMPDFLNAEYLLHTIEQLATFSKKPIHIQTRVPKHPLFTSLQKGNIKDFIQEDLKIRKAVGYPPFKKLIKITVEEKTQSALDHTIQTIVKDLKPYIDQYNIDVMPYPAFIGKVKSRYFSHILIKYKNNIRIDELQNFLRSLPQYIRVETNPITLL